MYFPTIVNVFSSHCECIFQPFRDMCRDILTREPENDKENTSILIDTTAQTESSETLDTSAIVKEAIEKDPNGANWCCTIS